MLIIRKVGGIEIFRASYEHEERVYTRIKESVFKHFQPGTYTDKSEIVKIVNLIYAQYYEILDEYFPKVDPRSFIIFLAAEYERYGKVADAYKNNKLSKDDEEFWASYAAYSRRGIKYLLELCCRSKMELSKVASAQEDREYAISMVFIAAEELVSLYMRSEHYNSFLDELTLTLNPEKYTYFNVEQDGILNFDIRKSACDLEKYIRFPMFLQDIHAHDDILNESFVDKLGVSYKDLIGTLLGIIETCSDSANPEALGKFKWQVAIREIANRLSITLSQAELILNGFCLSSENLEERELFRPKQEYRAYKRAFFKNSIDGVNCVYFSRRMALECLNLLICDVPFKKLPPEWCSKRVKKSLDVLSLKAGRWFEKVVEQNLNTIGIKGSSSIKALNLSKNNRLKVPDEIGEIDFLGFHEDQKLLVIIEVKQVGFATEPRMHLDDLSKFTYGPKSYSAKFIKKYNWVLDNIEEVEKHFSYKFNCTSKLNVAGYAMITLYQTMAAIKIKEFTCISLSEFMNEFTATEVWPFSKTQIDRL
ncbi:hypothetical protein [Gilliamella sp. WF3-4]|uniref:hypothetical protein n=1 Tax=Gilliamella sp. WF3-4 TaxID=3120255 RepID=UPI00080DF615|nr:hypothetical protein [Gilliamella apicola]OCG16955.1 hypothetical protein A9G47_09895 [Gilliamella apicola]